MVKAIKKVLVTGGAGFIGSHVVDELLSNGYSARIMDNLEPPTHAGVLPEWISQQAEFIKGDVRNKEDWRKALSGVDAVIHLAAYMDNLLDFSRYVRTNIESIALLFEVIEEGKLPIQKIIAASSQSVYGEGKYKCVEHGELYMPSRPSEQLERHDWEQKCPRCGEVLTPVPEKEDDILTPQIPYGISKLTSEHLLKNLGRRYNIPVVLFRFSIVLGPHQSFKHFYSGALRTFSVCALSGEPMTVNEDGLQTRDFVHVKDVASAHVKVLEDSRADYESFNVGGGVASRIIDLAKMVAQEAGVEFKSQVGNRYRYGDARHQHMDSSKLQALGWQPQYSLSDAVRDYVQWIKQFPNLKEALQKTNTTLQAQGIIKE
ncbi:MAG: NAD-dependent epimerase/dehydratase family protein [Patescibacteria group bacterium]